MLALAAHSMKLFATPAPSARQAPRIMLVQTPREISIRLPRTTLRGFLEIPARCRGVVLFVHGSGSSRFSRRNRFVAEQLRAAELGTLLFDLLTPRESEVDEQTRHYRFDIRLLSQRVIDVLDWSLARHNLREHDIGLFGASTGAAAALVAAAERPQRVAAVVSRGGRPDLAGAALARVQAPTLLIVGANDPEVLELNREAAAQLRCEHRIDVVAGASHLFEEPGTLAEAAAAACAWFQRHLGATTNPR